jgi:hypothetical protein
MEGGAQGCQDGCPIEFYSIKPSIIFGHLHPWSEHPRLFTPTL